MKKKIIAVDIDDTLAMFTPSFIRYANTNWSGSNIGLEDYSENWGLLFGIDDNEWQRRSVEIFEDANFYKQLELINGALEGVRYLREKYKIIVLTSRPKNVEADTVAWLNRNAFDFRAEDVYFSGFYDEGRTEHFKHKGNICKELGVDYLIDDHAKHCNGAVEMGLKAVLFGDYPWNKQDENLLEGSIKAPCWKEVINYFERQA